MNKKIVIGLMGGESCSRESVCKIFSNIGFYRTSISAKTIELAKHLLPGDRFPEETIDQIRERGYNVSNYYWINLVLASIPDDKNLILIDDLRDQDIIKGVIIPYSLDEGDSKNGIESINVNSKNLEEEIHSKIKRIAIK
ncbi:MAG: hypothetical protein WC119_03505 [Synergistaceae bacterium]